MTLPKRFNPRTAEPRLMESWQTSGTYHFRQRDQNATFIIDTPPPTVSGYLHLGHVYSYSHTDFVARFWRMNGRDVLYPMGFDDNGLPTERLVERHLGIRATDLGRQAFIQKCLEVSREFEYDYEALWQRLGLSIDWRYTYRTIDDTSRRLSQLSFLELARKDLAYRQKAPTIWCPECRTAIAQAELDDIERDSEFVTLPFRVDDGSDLAIATTRPELLPACVAVFVHPDDGRYQELVGHQAAVPLFNQVVPILADPEADPEKGTGAVMCCTFGDTTDVAWWYTHNLDLVEAIGRDGRLTDAAESYAGYPIGEARQKIKDALAVNGLILQYQPTSQSIRVHERCDTPVEYVVASQWFVRVLDFKEQLMAAGDRVNWYPDHMNNRYTQWVQNLNWDWCISRQRFFGVPIPVWYCDQCGEIILAGQSQLPLDPTTQQPDGPCECGSTDFSPDPDVMDTWATSSMTPQLVARWLEQSGFDGQPFVPVTLRPQAHEIIRTWAFYSLVKSIHHFNMPPWQDVAISGWGLAPEGSGKISKSRGGGPVEPMEMIERYSADAVRYWAASTGLGKDAVISEDKIQAGAKLVNKLWNVARFSQRFLAGYTPPASMPSLTLADRWILSRCHGLISRVTDLFKSYDYATAKSTCETFFWNDLADNYLEMVKKRLYEQEGEAGEAGRFTLLHVLLNTVKLFAPFLPFVTEEIYLGLFAEAEGAESVHLARWPTLEPGLVDKETERAGECLVYVATAVRRYKSNANLPLSAELPLISLTTGDEELAAELRSASADLMSITRALQVNVGQQTDPTLTTVAADGPVSVAIKP